MAKKVTKQFKIMAPGGKATPAPPIGPALGANGVILMGVGSSGSPVGMSVGAGSYGSHVGGGVGIGIPTTQKRAAGVAIWVPNPPPPPRLPTQTITPQR